MASATAERPLAAVTGATGALGYELARQFARAGFDLVVCAEDPDIVAVAKAFEAEGSSVVAVQCDLRQHDQVVAFYARIIERGRPLEAIAINAGVAVSGDFARETDLCEELRMIQLNVASTVHLTKLAARDMVARGRGRIAITASVAGTLPVPFQAVYGATKAFELSFAASLRQELKGSGVSVTTILLGPMETESFEGLDGGVDARRAPLAEEQDPAAVARQGFEGMLAGADRVYAAASPSAKLQGHPARVAPDVLRTRRQELGVEPGARGR